MRRSVEPRITPSRNQGSSNPAAPPLTDEERRLAADALRVLGTQYFVSKNKLMRAVNRATDLNTVILKQRNATYRLVEEIAAAVGLSASEFMAVSSLSKEQSVALASEIRVRGLIEARQLRLVESSS